MSIPAADLRKLVTIVRQYEVIYGGGISSGDAAVREECESIVGVLEAELGIRKIPLRKAGRGERSLPSLVDVKKMPRRNTAPRPTKSSSVRASEMASLGLAKSESVAPGGGDKKSGKASSGASAQGKPKTGGAVGSAKAVPAKKTKAESAAVAGGKTGKVSRGEGARAKSAAAPLPSAVPAWGKEEDDEVLKDVRSRHVHAVKAALERDARITGAADSSGEAETKRRFAAQHLFEAFRQNKLPKYGGFIVAIRFDEKTGYSVIEIIGYENLQDIYPEGETLVFKSVGCKLYAIVEPTNYYLKSVEPVNRPSEQMIPYRFSELLRITTKRFQTILIGRKPVFMPTSFSVFKPAGEDLVVLFYDIADVYANIQDFIIMVLRDRLGIPIPDSRKAGEVIARGIHEFKIWMDEA